MNNHDSAWGVQQDGFGLNEDSHLTSGTSIPVDPKPNSSPSAFQMAAIAGKGLAKGFGAVSSFATNNSWGLRLISFGMTISFMILAVLGLFDVVGVSRAGRPGSFYLFNAYMLLLAGIAFIAECKDEWTGFGVLRPWTMKQFGFLQSNLGRGVFLFFIGIIWFSAWGLLWGLLGLLAMIIGVLYITVHMKYPAGEPQALPLSGSP